MTSFPRILLGVSTAYREEPDKVRQSASEIQAFLRRA